MSDDLTVSEHEHGLIRVFRGSYQLSKEMGHTGTFDRLCTALGIARIDRKDVQRFETRTLDDMALSHFIADAYEVDPADLAPHAKALDSIDGMVVIVRSGAFLDRPATLTLNDDVTLVATLSEPGSATMITPPILTKSAEGILTPPTKKAPSDAAMSGRVATIALLVMAFLVWLMIKVAS